MLFCALQDERSFVGGEAVVGGSSLGPVEEER